MFLIIAAIISERELPSVARRPRGRDGRRVGDGQTDDFFDAKVKVLQEQIEHHVEEEEKRLEGMFSQARKAGLDMEALGLQLAERKADLVAKFEATGVPKPTLTTMTEPA
jgi:hypothetical protein